jgi:hypothetical protein
VTNPERYRSIDFNEWLKPVRIDDRLTSLQLVDPASIHGIALHRSL